MNKPSTVISVGAWIITLSDRAENVTFFSRDWNSVDLMARKRLGENPFSTRHRTSFFLRPRLVGFFLYARTFENECLILGLIPGRFGPNDNRRDSLFCFTAMLWLWGFFSLLPKREGRIYSHVFLFYLKSITTLLN